MSAGVFTDELTRKRYAMGSGYIPKLWDLVQIPEGLRRVVRWTWHYSSETGTSYTADLGPTGEDRRQEDLHVVWPEDQPTTPEPRKDGERGDVGRNNNIG